MALEKFLGIWAQEIHEIPHRKVGKKLSRGNFSRGVRIWPRNLRIPRSFGLRFVLGVLSFIWAARTPKSTELSGFKPDLDFLTHANRSKMKNYPCEVQFPSKIRSFWPSFNLRLRELNKEPDRPPKLADLSDLKCSNQFKSVSIGIIWPSYPCERVLAAQKGHLALLLCMSLTQASERPLCASTSFQSPRTASMTPEMDSATLKTPS